MINNMDAKQTRQLVDAITRGSLSAFARKAFEIADKSQKFIDNWHIELICDELEKCLRGETKRLIITMPPRNLKTFLVSIAFPAFLLGHRPESRILNISYSQDLAKESSRACKKIMNSKFYKSIFKTRLSQDKQTEDKFETTENGYRYATSINGTLTGLGGNFIIIDDPIKANDANSETARRQIIDWYKNTLISRLNNKENDVMILVMQRLHIDDLAGYLMKDDDWKVLKLPAIASNDEAYDINGKIVGRKKGEALCPKLESLTTLEKTHKNMGDYIFSAQYQQEPIPEDGNIIAFKDFQRYINIPQNETGVKVQSWDVALTTGANNDYSVCVTATIINNIVYIEDIYRYKLSPVALQNKIIQMKNLYNPKFLYIEDSVISKTLIDNLKQQSVNIIPVKPNGSKIERALSMIVNIQNGTIQLPNEAEWLDAFREECKLFPSGSHDDQIDALSQLSGQVTDIIDKINSVNSLKELYHNEGSQIMENIIRRLKGEPTKEELDKLTPEESQIYGLYNRQNFFNSPLFKWL